MKVYQLLLFIIMNPKYLDNSLGYVGNIVLHNHGHQLHMSHDNDCV